MTWKIQIELSGSTQPRTTLKWSRRNMCTSVSHNLNTPRLEVIMGWTGPKNAQWSGRVGSKWAGFAGQNRIGPKNRLRSHLWLAQSKKKKKQVRGPKSSAENRTGPRYKSMQEIFPIREIKPCHKAYWSYHNGLIPI